MRQAGMLLFGARARSSLSPTTNTQQAMPAESRLRSTVRSAAWPLLSRHGLLNWAIDGEVTIYPRMEFRIPVPKRLCRRWNGIWNWQDQRVGSGKHNTAHPRQD